jgi:DNA ligase-1
LFRQALLLTPEDLIHLIYLSSNTVAPSYECVELGVGDSILIKAVGESFGTNPSIIKLNYNKQGDLGKVAETAKSSQRTLNFATKSPKSLSVKEVLHTFRLIAANSTQKLKVEKIKSLLVRCTKDTQEAKFVIRGLQGKLRIGLAQSTVLISLAHALLLTQSKMLPHKDDEKDSSPENEEDTVLNDSKIAIEERLDSAVRIVKKAYSELPSFDAIIEASLKTPLHKLHLVCTLKPGIPVEPMLAKPTKSCAEVLKRLNGLRFTCEFKVSRKLLMYSVTYFFLFRCSNPII